MRLGILANLTKPAIWAAVPEALAWCAAHGVGVVLEAELAAGLASRGLASSLPAVAAAELPTAADALLVFGGDGTLLGAARLARHHPIPLLAVNLGKLGFLAEVDVAHLPDALDEWFAGRTRIEPRLALEARTVEPTAESDRDLWALNDIVIDKGGFARMIRVEVHLDDEYLNTYVADGLIIATPTGATGYSLSAGGPLLDPTLPAFVISPICPHTLAARPVVVPVGRRIRLSVRSESPEVVLMLDGRIGRVCGPTLSVEIGAAVEPVQLIKRPGASSYAVLREKLMWGRDLRTAAGRDPDESGARSA